MNGYINEQNCHICVAENPEVIIKKPLHSTRVTVWCAFWSGGVTGPYYFLKEAENFVTVNRLKDDFYSMLSLHGHAGLRFDVKGWSPKIDLNIFEEPKNHRVFQDLKVCKQMIFSESRLYMARHGCILMLRVEARKSLWTFFKARKSEGVCRR